MSSGLGKLGQAVVVESPREQAGLVEINDGESSLSS